MRSRAQMRWAVFEVGEVVGLGDDVEQDVDFLVLGG